MLDCFIIKIDSSRVWIDAKTSNYFEHILSFISAVAGSVSISYFAFLVGIPIGIANSVAKILQELKIIIQLSRKRRKNMVK